LLYSKKLGSIKDCAAYFFGKIGCNGRLFVFLDKNNYFFKKTLFYFFVGYFILWKSLKLIRTDRENASGSDFLKSEKCPFDSDATGSPEISKCRHSGHLLSCSVTSIALDCFAIIPVFLNP